MSYALEVAFCSRYRMCGKQVEATVAKKRETEREEDRAASSTSGIENQSAAHRSDLEAAVARIAEARRALGEAEAAFRSAGREESEPLGKASGLTVSEVIDSTSEFVRRHPKVGVLAAGVIGFLLGRSLRR